MREYIGKTDKLNPEGRLDQPLMRREYSSLMDFCKDAKRGVRDFRDDYGGGYGGGMFGYSFSHVRDWDEIERLCRDGWEEKLPETLEVTERAVRYVETETQQFEPHHAVAGCDVDVAAAVAGLPEDMIAYPLTRVSNVGTLITICCDVQTHAGVSTDAIIKRGMVIVALALALDSIGHQTDLWLSDEYTAGASRAILRTHVKSPNDMIDPAKIMFAYAHPAVQRGLGFCAVAGMPAPWSTISRQGFGHVSGITKDLPEGTIYMEPVFRYGDAPNADRELKMYLTQLGLLRTGEDDFEL